MAGIKIFGFTITRSNTEKEIHKLFQLYEKTLFQQKQKMSDDITEWADALIQSIYENMNQQKYYLDRKYAKQVKYLNETYNQFIEELHVQEQINNTEEVNQLLEQYKALEYQLDALETTLATIPFIQLSSTKNSVIKGRDEFAATENSTMSQFDNDLTEEFDNISDNSMNRYLASSSNLSYSRTKQANQQSFTIVTSNNDNRSVSSCNDILEECPICVMAFPSNMAPNDRITHVNEHSTHN